MTEREDQHMGQANSRAKDVYHLRFCRRHFSSRNVPILILRLSHRCTELRKWRKQLLLDAPAQSAVRCIVRELVVA